MVGSDPPGQQIVGQKGSRLLLARYRMQIFPGGSTQAAGLDVHQHRTGIDRLIAALVAIFPSITWSRTGDVAGFASEVRGPEPALATVERGDDGLVERRIPLHQPGVALGERRGISATAAGYSALANSRRSQKGQP